MYRARCLASLGAKRASLEEIFSTCQIISNHVANLPATVGMIDGKLLHSMLPNAAFINTGRGAQVVESELIAALKACPDRTALLDVTWPEPPEEGSEFYTLPNVLPDPAHRGQPEQRVGGAWRCTWWRNSSARRIISPSATK